MACGLGGGSPYITNPDADSAPAEPTPEQDLDLEADPADPADPDPAVDAMPDPFEADWIFAPAGWCDDPANLAKVVKVVDGDTVEIVGQEKIRYIGVDAPETYKDECWSQEARSALKNLMAPGWIVCLREDEGSSPLDPYGRLLRYVFSLDGEERWVMQNARLVRQGSARAYHQFLKGKDYAFEIKQAENSAKEDNIGLWADCE